MERPTNAARWRRPVTQKIFNVTGTCFPHRHYMVDLSWRLAAIKEMIDRGDYFAINRGRQYGKTTTLWSLETYLQEEYLVVSLDFQSLDTDCFANADIFSRSFWGIFLESIELQEECPLDEETMAEIREFVDNKGQNLNTFLKLVYKVNRVSTKPIVLLIDEVDSASNNQVFIDFLAVLRLAYLRREDVPTFQSVILAGVYNIRHLKAKIRPEDQHKYNSPWNIAAQFDVRMWFDAEDIAGMLQQYEDDHHSGMNIKEIADGLFHYTSGYPVMVSWLCKIMDEQLKDFSKAALDQAVQMMLNDPTVPVFESMMRQLDLYPRLKELLSDLLYSGKEISYVPDDNATSLGEMFCYLKRDGNHLVIANRIFEQRLMKLLVYQDSIDNDTYQEGAFTKNQFVREDGSLDMPLVLEKFAAHFNDIYNDKDIRFVEKTGRKLFMLYLKPIINGTGNYYIEPETRDSTRSDLVVDYRGEQFIIEMKIWRGDLYNKRGEKQLTEYLDYFHCQKGYMLSFCFNKDKQTGVKTISVGDKTIVEAVV